MIRIHFKTLQIVCAAFAFLLGSSQASAQTFLLSDDAFHEHAQISMGAIYKNLDHPQVRPGAAIASPSQAEPNYFYHWVRDAALVMDTLVTAYEHATDPGRKQELQDRILRWVVFETLLQNTPNPSGGPGEPKFHVDGQAYTGEWGRPQNDGSAARAITMIRFARVLISEGKEQLVRRYLYNGGLPPEGPIKTDLEFTARAWLVPSFDLWEEIKGHHFYTRMLQRTALVTGAELAYQLGDFGAARFYQEQAAHLDRELTKHINVSKGIVEPTLIRTGGWDHKHMSLDVAVVLGSLHSANADGFFAPHNQWILSSAEKLESVFQQIYPVNAKRALAFNLGTAIGRYPEDVYDGNGFGGGNPWFLATHAYAELYCEAARGFARHGEIRATPANQGFLRKAVAGRVQIQPGQIYRRGQEGFAEIIDSVYLEARKYLARSLFHRGPGGSMSEQYNRYNGYMGGATHLTWSYASYLTAYHACFGYIP